MGKAQPPSASQVFLHKRYSVHTILSQKSFYSLHQNLPQYISWWFKNMAGLQSRTPHGKYTDTEVWWPFCCEIIDVGRLVGSARCATANYIVASVHCLVLSLLSSKRNLIFLERGALSKKKKQTSNHCSKEFICSPALLCEPKYSLISSATPLASHSF